MAQSAGRGARQQIRMGPLTVARRPPPSPPFPPRPHRSRSLAISSGSEWAGTPSRYWRRPREAGGRVTTGDGAQVACVAVGRCGHSGVVLSVCKVQYVHTVPCESATAHYIWCTVSTVQCPQACGVRPSINWYANAASLSPGRGFDWGRTEA